MSKVPTTCDTKELFTNWFQINQSYNLMGMISSRDSIIKKSILFFLFTKDGFHYCWHSHTNRNHWLTVHPFHHYVIYFLYCRWIQRSNVGTTDGPVSRDSHFHHHSTTTGSLFSIADNHTG